MNSVKFKPFSREREREKERQTDRQTDRVEERERDTGYTLNSSLCILVKSFGVYNKILNF